MADERSQVSNMPDKSSSLVADKRQENTAPANESERSALPAGLGLIELLGVFVLALALRCLYNYSFVHVNNFAACDAFEYINNGQALLQLFSEPASFWQKSLYCLLGAANAADWLAVKNALVPLKDFYISGPVFPAFLALNAALTGSAVGNVHHLWQVLLFGNSLVSALSCLFIALLANEAFGKRTARIAGILAILYPGFIVNSGRLYSETLATFLLVALSYITVRGFRSAGNNMLLVFLSGFLAACLQLTRSVMAVLSLAILPLTAIQQKAWKKLFFVLPFALGFALVAAPWLGFQKLAFGGGGLVVDRVGHYNFFIGNNVDTQGWLSYPYPDGRNVEDRTFPQLLNSAVKKSPARWLRLMLDKPLRLFEFPWNDFRTEIGPIKFKWQVAFHELILLLSLMGLGVSLFLGALRAPSRRELYCRLYLAGLYSFHCIYYLFITVPRYNLTAIPEMIIFAGAALALGLQLLEEPNKRRVGLFCAAAVALLFIVLRSNFIPFIAYTGVSAETAWVIQALLRCSALVAICSGLFLASKLLHGYKKPALIVSGLLALAVLPLLLMPLRANGRYLEWFQDISVSSVPLKQTLKMPLTLAETGAKRGLFLLLDTDGVRQPSSGLAVRVNGRSLCGPFLPSMAFAENFDRFLELGPDSVQREGERMWDSLTNSAACGNLDLRQWCMVPIADSVLQEAIDKCRRQHTDSVRFDVIVQNHSETPLRIYGSYSVSERERLLPSVDVYSWEKVFYGVENAEGLTDTRYDIKVPAATLVSSRQDLSEQAGIQNGVFNMAFLIQPPTLAESANASASAGFDQADRQDRTKVVAMKKLASFELAAGTADSPSGFVRTSEIPNLKPEQDSIFLFRLRGRSRVLAGNACPAAEIQAIYKRPDGSTYSYKSAWTPRRLSASREWKDFEFVLPVKPIVNASTLKEGIADFKIAAPESPYLNVDKPFAANVEYAGLVLDIYELPSNPIGLGHQVY